MGSALNLSWICLKSITLGLFLLSFFYSRPAVPNGECATFKHWFFLLFKLYHQFQHSLGKVPRKYNRKAFYATFEYLVAWELNYIQKKDDYATTITSTRRDVFRASYIKDQMHSISGLQWKSKCSWYTRKGLIQEEGGKVRQNPWKHISVLGGKRGFLLNSIRDYWS